MGVQMVRFFFVVFLPVVIFSEIVNRVYNFFKKTSGELYFDPSFGFVAVYSVVAWTLLFELVKLIVA